jgi:G3E family GTPase
VIIETTGLADPAPILQALTMDRHLTDDYRLGAVVTTVDCIAGMDALDGFAEAKRQVAVADRIVLTKTDITAAGTKALTDRLAALNPIAPVVLSPRDSAGLLDLFSSGAGAARTQVVSGWPGAHGDLVRARHRETTEELRAVAVTRDAPMRAVTLSLFLSALAGNCGASLLRMKGIVAIAECPGRPAVIHGVQHVYHAPEFLPAWPSSDRRTRLVLIGHRLRASWVNALIDLLDAEVASEESLTPARAP